jgi:hypothetical protein
MLFDALSFNKILCFGVFDACNQEKTLKEICRVLDVEGCALITGKNTSYHNDDMVKIAEVNARKKGHPNYFTNYKIMREQLISKKYTILEEYFYERRGDFAKNCYMKNKAP